MQETPKAGTILIKEGTLLPQTLRCQSEPCAPGWNSVKSPDGDGLDRQIHEAGWTFLPLVGEINATVFGLDERTMTRKAVEQILANLDSQKSNSLEIVRVASVASKRFLGVLYVTVSAHSRHIQERPFLIQTTDIKLKQPEFTTTL